MIRRRALVTALLLAGPVVLFFLLDVRPMDQLPSIDAYFYAGYLAHFRDLLFRVGDWYFVTRFGLIVPGTIAGKLFGHVGGFFVLRYVLSLLAAIPAYLLFRRYFGRAGGAIAYLVILTSPIYLRALMWDYVDSVAVPYLLCGTCLLMLEGRRRLFELIGSGVAFALAGWSNPATLTLSAIIVASYFAISFRVSRPRLVRELGILALCGMATTAMVVLWYGIRYDLWDVFSPNFHAVNLYATGQMDPYLVTNLTWVKREVQVYLPALALGSWLIVGSWHEAPRFERALVVALGGAFGWFLVWQFILGGNPLNVFYYFSLLAPSLFLVCALVLVRIWRGRAHARALAATAALLVAFPLLRNLAFPDLAINDMAVYALLGAMALALCAVSLRVPRVRVVAVAGFVATMFMFTLGQSTSQARYDLVMGRGGGDRELAVFRVSHDLVDALPKAPGDPRVIRFWYPSPGGKVQSYLDIPVGDIGTVQSIYGFVFTRLAPLFQPGLPALSVDERSLLTYPLSQYLVILTHSYAQARTGLDALSVDGISFHESWQRTLRQGGYSLVVTLLSIPR